MSKFDKRYYWLKLGRGFFKRHDIKIIEAMPKGKEYVLFYMKMLCESVDHEGNLRFSERIPYTPEMLATITNTDVEIVGSAMEVFKELGLLEVKEDETIFMSELPSMIGSETGMAQYMRDRRKKQKMLGEFENVELDKDEIEKLKSFYPNNWAEYIEKLSAHKEATGKVYESDYATLKSWLTKDIGLLE